MTAPSLAPKAAIVTDAGLSGEFTVYVEYPDARVDRPRTFGWQVADIYAAERLAAAINAHRATANETVRFDTDGKTYVSATHLVLGRTMNADLTRLGF